MSFSDIPLAFTYLNALISLSLKHPLGRRFYIGEKCYREKINTSQTATTTVRSTTTEPTTTTEEPTTTVRTSYLTAPRFE